MNRTVQQLSLGAGEYFMRTKLQGGTVGDMHRHHLSGSLARGINVWPEGNL
jgi:hypothetical protein